MSSPALPVTEQREAWLDRPLIPGRAVAAWIVAHRELLLYTVLVLAGLLLRLWSLGARAVHHDESLHAYYSWQLYIGKGYSYDPLMHGPLQFEVVPLFYLLFGVSDFSARLFAAVLGTALIFLPYFLRAHLTRPGAFLASVMIAISPSLVYYSRFIRDDIYLAFFTLVLFIALIKYLERPRPYLLYVASAALALGVASMEAAYLTTFIFGSFILVEAVREAVTREGPVLRAVRATNLDTWLTAVSIFVVIIVLLYSTFFTNPYGIWDTQHSLMSPDRKDIWGGLTYWLAQQPVARGGQPWFYYLLLLPLYEQLALLLGVAGMVYAAVRRTLFRTFLVWWALIAFGLYSWAGEKMPWLVIHIVLPLILLAGLFVGEIFAARRLWPKIAVGTALVLGLALETHSTFLLNFVDGANPTEMLIYVQTSNDVKHVTHEVQALSRRVTGGNTMQIGLDTNDVGGWPFIWYLRNNPNVVDAMSFNGPVCGAQYCPALIMLGPEFDASRTQLMQHYVVQKYRWNWWFPEDYKVWFPQHWGNIPQALHGHGSLTDDLLGTPTDWHHIWNWLMYRTPFGTRSARWLYFLVRRDLVPHASQYPGGITRGLHPLSLLTTAGGLHLSAPRGLALGLHGTIWVADTLNHRVVGFGPGGRVVAAIGSAGTARGQFSPNNSPEGIGVASNGDLYVADTWNQRIEVFSPQGRFLRSWGGGPIGSKPGQFYGPRSVAVAASGAVYVADTGNKRIQVFSPQGKFRFSWGTQGAGPGQFNEPSAVAVAPNGTVYVADFWNRRIQAFTAQGHFLRSWTVPDWSPGTYEEPYLAVARNGDIYATDPTAAKILVFSPSGLELRRFAVSAMADPIGLAVTSSGQVAVSDPTANAVALVHPAAAHSRNSRPATSKKP